ncbi:Protein of unknown function, partial [Gryllus bimaculatus]
MFQATDEHTGSKHALPDASTSNAEVSINQGEAIQTDLINRLNDLDRQRKEIIDLIRDVNRQRQAGEEGNFSFPKNPARHPTSSQTYQPLKLSNAFQSIAPEEEMETETDVTKTDSTTTMTYPTNPTYSSKTTHAPTRQHRRQIGTVHIDNKELKDAQGLKELMTIAPD